MVIKVRFYSLMCDDRGDDDKQDDELKNKWNAVRKKEKRRIIRREYKTHFKD